MFPVGSLYLPRCARITSELGPCGFKQMWFNDIPLSMPVNSEDSGRAMVVRSCHDLYRLTRIMKKHIFDMILANIQFTLICHFQRLNINLIQSILQHQPIIRLKMPSLVKFKVPVHHKPDRPNLLSIPVELRLKIFDCVMDGVNVRAVGYRKGNKDAFYFKERGKFGWLSPPHAKLPPTRQSLNLERILSLSYQVTAIL